MTPPNKTNPHNRAGKEPGPQEVNVLVTLFKQGRYAEIEALARKMTMRFPKHGFGWKALGTALLQQGCAAGALAPLQKAIELSQDAQLHNNLGNALAKLNRLYEAEASYRQALKLNPGFAEAHHNLGNTLMKLDRLIEAEASHRRALELKPDFAEAHNNLGNTLAKLNRLPEAGASYQQALKISPGFVDAHHNLGDALQGLGRMLEAEASYRRALAIRPGFVKSHSNLGNLLQGLGRLPEAEASYRHALEIDPECSEALLGLALISKERGEMEKAEDLLLQALEIRSGNLAARFHLTLVNKVKAEDANFRALVDTAEAASNDETMLSEMDMTFLHFALGKCYDDTGDYGKAFPHFLEGCKLKRSTLDYDPDQTTQQFAGLMRIFDRATIDRLRGAGNPSRLPIFVLGMPRSGTTLTEQIIASHPEVYGAGELPDLMKIVQRHNPGTTTRFTFPGNLRLLDQATLTAWGAGYVAGLQQRAPAARHITDKMPANFLAIGLIHLMLPNARIIHVKRNPVDTCLSCFTRLFDKQEFTYDLAELGRYYVDYFRLMEHWREVLPAGTFLDVQYEDIVAGQEGQARRLIEYCGLEWNDACLDFHKNKRSIKTASVMQVRQPLYKSSVERWRHYEKFLDPLLDALEYLAPKRG